MGRYSKGQKSADIIDEPISLPVSS